MNSRVRAALLLAPVLGLGLAFVVQRSGTKPAETLRGEASSSGEELGAARTAPRPAAVSAVAPPPPQPAASSAAEDSSEESLAAAAHALEDSSPERALELARRARALWPDGPRAPEFAATEVKCLYRLGRPSEGRGAAEAMVNRYPTSPWALEVEKQTGAHPYVNH